MRAMILAAGLGTRMAPLTQACAKCVLPVLDEPLLARHLRQLAAQGVERAVVNAHAHPEQIRELAAKSPIPVDISFEPELLGSGGGILAARRLLEGREPFLVVNADMCIDLDVPALLRAHAESGAAATLVLRDEPRKHELGTIGYAAGGLVSRITNVFDRGSETGSGLFAGVHVFEPQLFSLMPERSAFDVLTDVYVPLLERGGHIAAWLQPRSQRWWPAGTPRELLDTNLLALHEACAAPSAPVDAVLLGHGARVCGEVRGPAWIGAGAAVESGATAGPDVVIGAGASLRAGTSARETLLLPGAKPRPGRLERAIGFDTEVWSDA